MPLGAIDNEPGDRPAIDDRASLARHHLTADDLARHPDRVEIGVEDALPIRVIQRQRIGVKTDAGVVHEHVDRSKLIRDGREHGLEIAPLGDIRRHRDRARAQAAQFGQRILVLLFVARDDGDHRSGLGEPERNGLADAPIAAGDDCNLTPQRELVEYRHH